MTIKKLVDDAVLGLIVVVFFALLFMVYSTLSAQLTSPGKEIIQKSAEITQTLYQGWEIAGTIGTAILLVGLIVGFLYWRNNQNPMKNV